LVYVWNVPGNEIGIVEPSSLVAQPDM
jgi:hypothetical protein